MLQAINLKFHQKCVQASSRKNLCWQLSYRSFTSLNIIKEFITFIKIPQIIVGFKYFNIHIILMPFLLFPCLLYYLQIYWEMIIIFINIFMDMNEWFKYIIICIFFHNNKMCLKSYFFFFFRQMASLNIGRAGACVVVIKQPWLIFLERFYLLEWLFYIRGQEWELLEMKILQEKRFW